MNLDINSKKLVIRTVQFGVNIWIANNGGEIR